MSKLNSRHQRTIAAIFSRPPPASLAWRDIEALLRALDATITEGRGSRMRVELNGGDAVFHRPHPRPETGKKAVTAVRDFLIAAGVDESWSTKDT